MSLLPRSGSTNLSSNDRYDYWQFDKSTGKTVCWETGYPIKDQYLSSFSGFSIPGFHKRVRRGELLPHTPWRQSLMLGSRSGSIGPLSAIVKPSDIDTWWTTGNFPIVTPWPSISECEALFPADAQALVQNAAAQIVGESHDTLTFLAELANTRKMFIETGRRFLKLEIPRNWKQLSNDWLSYRYGWRTFMYDCKDLHKAVKRLDEKRTRYSKRSKNVDTWSSSQNVHLDTNFLGTSFRCSKSVSDTYEVSAVGTVNADITIPSFSFNPVTTAWELIPYSFVVDWFLEIGKSLTAMTFLASQRRYSASWGCRVTIDRNVSMTGYSIKSGVTGNLVGQGSGQAILEVRVPCSVPLTPQLSFKIDTSKVVDLLAMVIQRI